mmetsp:Transcript_158006/g.506760  ORF Transcript_158006/g.506760 Transcript_158006/m.506760 type:complete len:241 (+) Transcript_158006:434-1156(+)
MKSPLGFYTRNTNKRPFIPHVLTRATSKRFEHQLQHTPGRFGTRNVLDDDIASILDMAGRSGVQTQPALDVRKLFALGDSHRRRILTNCKAKILMVCSIGDLHEHDIRPELIALRGASAPRIFLPIAEDDVGCKPQHGASRARLDPCWPRHRIEARSTSCLHCSNLILIRRVKAEAVAGQRLQDQLRACLVVPCDHLDGVVAVSPAAQEPLQAHRPVADQFTLDVVARKLASVVQVDVDG